MNYMVSIIIPNYNHAKYLKQRIDSVLSQTYQDFELIILDDCSIDNSREVISLYENHPKVSHVVYNTNNSGSTFKQWKKGIELANGDWIWIAESDDFCEKVLLSELVRRVEQEENLAIVYSQSYQVDETGLILGDMTFHTDSLDLLNWKSDYFNYGTREIKKYLLYRNTIPNASAVLFKKAAYLKVNKSFEKMKLCGDWMLWVQLLKQGNIAYCSKPLNYFRTHSATTRVLDNYKKLRLRLEEEYEIAINISNFFCDENNLLFSRRKDELIYQYSLCFPKTEILRSLKSPKEFYYNTVFYDLIKRKIKRIFGIIKKTN